MNKIQKISTYFIFVFNILIVMTLLTQIIHWVFIGISANGNSIITFLHTHMLNNSTIDISGKIINLNKIDWLPSLRLLGLSSSLISALPSVLGFFILKKIFKNYRRGEIFSVANALFYKKLGWLFCLNALFIRPLCRVLTTIAVTFHNAPGFGKRVIIVDFGTPNLEDIFIGVMLIVISWIMVEATKIHDEQKLTV